MSLTTELQYPSSPIRRFIDERFGASIARCVEAIPAGHRLLLKNLALPAPGESANDSWLIGAAFDYRVRFYFESVPARSWVAHDGAELLAVASPSSVMAPLSHGFFQELYGLLDRINPVGNRLEQSEEELLARYCIVLAHLESVYRSGLGNRSPLRLLRPDGDTAGALALATSSQVADLCRLSWAFYEEAADLLREEATCNPVFDGSSDVGGADADLIVGDCLFELKTATRAQPSQMRRWLRQLVGYMLLDYGDSLGIRRVAVYSARHRCFVFFPLVELLGCGEQELGQVLAEQRTALKRRLSGEQPDSMRIAVESRTHDPRGEAVSEKIVHIDGHEVLVSEQLLELDQIRFDSANPRIQFQLDTALTDAPPTQDALGYALTVSNDQYERLRDNVEANRGVLHPIWVAPDGDGYLVIEGNTRLQVFVDLRDKYPDDPGWQRIPACVLPRKCSKEQFHFLRLEAHLFGTTPWDAYEKAKYLYLLSTEEDYSLDRLSRLTKLSPSDIRSHIQAFRDMEQQYLKAYPEPSEHLKFSYFVEFRKNADLKRLVEAHELSLVDFCDWVGTGKFRRGEDIRRLGAVLRDPAAKQQLIDSDFETALDQLALRNPGARSPLFDKVEAVIAGIREMPYSEISEIRGGRQPRKVELLQELAKAPRELLEDLQRA
jgi:hypothetical protein